MLSFSEISHRQSLLHC